MGKRRRITSSRSIERRIREGRGQGTLRDYLPWLVVHDVPSAGFATRVLGWTTGREHHLFSRLETSYLYILDWASDVTDIREQYPLLPIDETIAIAEAIGVKHPTNPKSKEHEVMTTDFLVTVRQNGRTTDVARAAKRSTGRYGLSSARALEKLEIERRYWAAHKTDWGIVTEKEIPDTVVTNVKWLHRYRDLNDLPTVTHNTVDRVRRFLEARLNAEEPLSSLTNTCDDSLGLEPGTSLLTVRHLLATLMWQIDITVPLSASSPLRVLKIASPARRKAASGGRA